MNTITLTRRTNRQRSRRTLKYLPRWCCRNYKSILHVRALRMSTAKASVHQASALRLAGIHATASASTHDDAFGESCGRADCHRRSLLDLALEMLDIASRKLSPSPIKRQAVGLGAARWRNVSPEERSKASGAPCKRAGPNRVERRMARGTQSKK